MSKPCGSQNDTLEIGAVVRIAGTVKDNDILVDPSGVTLIVKPPKQVTRTPNLVHEGLGEFATEFVVDVAGQWFYRWESTSPISAEEGSFLVRKSKVT